MADAYMGAPWTRDGTVRTYVVTMAPEITGRIVELSAADNQFVHKGDLLLVIDPTNYKIALQLADAAVDQAQATAQNAARQNAAANSTTCRSRWSRNRSSTRTPSRPRRNISRRSPTAIRQRLTWSVNRRDGMTPPRLVMSRT
ncbi:biotin/lipoyl-binding protein [Bradyrhizobium sp. Ash2021]|uniref:biotin/lipoyl-binding protein n=1 Tax=Bradyrhizobium sp. Ash2021 TaxID=2954771 RepID=UPI0028154EC9|nr:biotin/lipoyl-binding protein [Bradyrhizobium sp. Ash2021]WMT76509.1 biotin/lipoyl-binding protein [Bradyrhizobium sp. Ash2021]